jgi:hypothetical protein
MHPEEGGEVMKMENGCEEVKPETPEALKAELKSVPENGTSEIVKENNPETSPDKAVDEANPEPAKADEPSEEELVPKEATSADTESQSQTPALDNGKRPEITTTSDSSVLVMSPTSPRSMTTASISASGKNTKLLYKFYSNLKM